MNIQYINKRLQLTATGLVWTQGKWTKGKEAGDARGVVSLASRKYTKESVIAALSAQDTALLIPAGKATGTGETAKAKEDITDLTSDDTFVAIEARYAAAARALEVAKAALQEAKQELTAYAADGAVQGLSFKIKKFNRQGSVSYSRVVREHLPSIDLSAYRGEQVEYFTVKAL
jgi:hypothetical protein